MEVCEYSPVLPYGKIDFSFRVFTFSHYPFFVKKNTLSHEKPTELHLHDFPQIWYCVRGTYKHYIKNKVAVCGEGSLVVIPPGTGHAFEMENGSSAELICIQGTFFFFKKLPEPLRTKLLTGLFLQNFGAELGIIPSFFYELCGDEKARFDDILGNLSKIDYHESISNIASVRKQIGELFSLASFELSKKQQKTASRIIETKLEPIMNVILYINKNFDKKVTSDDFIKVSAMCYSDFFKYFKKIAGVTYTAYLHMLRLRRALLYVAFTQYSFEYIATICGFTDRTYFGKLFKKYYARTLSDERAKQPLTKQEFPFLHITHESLHKLNMEYETE